MNESRDEVAGEDRKPRPIARRGSGRSRGAGAGFLFGEIVELDTGLVVARSFGKTLQMLARLGLGAFAGLGCLVGGIFAVFAGFGFFKNNDNPVLVVLGGIAIGFTGAALLFFTIGGLVAYVAILRYKERFIIGKKFLQRIIDAAKANMQVAFTNIDRIRLDTKVEGDLKYEFIGIDLVDPEREGTIMSGAGLKSFRRDFGFDVAIFDDYEIPLGAFYKKLVARWKKAVDEAAAADQAAGTALPAARRRPSWESGGDERPARGTKQRSAGLFIGLGIGGVALLVVLGILLTVAKRNSIPNLGLPNPNIPQVAAPVTGDPALDKLLADLGDPKPFAGQNAAEKLAKMQPNEHRPVVAQRLAELAESPDLFTRKAMRRALGVWATPNEVPVLINGLDDADFFTRQEMLEVIGKFKDVRAAAPVVRCFRDASLRGPAERALREMGPVAEKALLAVLDAPDPFLCEGAIKILKDIGTQQSVPALQAATAHIHAFVQTSAREALTAIMARTKK